MAGHIAGAPFPDFKTQLTETRAELLQTLRTPPILSQEPEDFEAPPNLLQPWDCAQCNATNVTYMQTLAVPWHTQHRHTPKPTHPYCLCVPLAEVPNFPQSMRHDIIIAYNNLSDLIQRPVIHGVKNNYATVTYNSAKHYIRDIHPHGTEGERWHNWSQRTLLPKEPINTLQCTTDQTAIDAALVIPTWRYGYGPTPPTIIHFVPFVVVRYDPGITWPFV